MNITTLNEHLNWRAAVKNFNPDKKVSAKDLEQLLEAMNLAPSSFGLQPYRFYVISDDATKEKMAAAGYGQPQFSTASHLVVFASDKQVSEADVDAYVDNIAKTRKVAKEDLTEYAQMMKGSIASKSADELESWAARQAYIPVGVLMAAASVAKVDASPMEGFDAAEVSNIIGATEKGYMARVVVALGYRSETDHYGKIAKVRKPLAEIVTMIS